MGEANSTLQTRDSLPEAVRVCGARINGAPLERDDSSSNRHPVLAFCLSMIPRVKAEGMLFGKPLHTFPDHALVLLRHKFSSRRYVLATARTSRQCSCDGIGQANAHGRDRVRDVAFRPQWRLLWVGNLRE